MAYRSFIFGTPDDGSYCGFTGTFTAGENLTKWQAVYMAANGKVYKAKGDATGTLPPLGIATANASADASVVVLVWGKARNVSGWNWTLGAGVAGLVYVDPDTAGAPIQGDPNTIFDVGQTAAIIGFAFDADTLFVTPNTTTVTKGDTPLVSGGALGTPASGTLTNCTGLPVAGITASTSTALGVGSIELGHASDTSIARSAAGVVTIETVQVAVVPDDSQTVATSATPTPAVGTIGREIHYYVTALAEGATFGAPTGTPVNGQKLRIRITDDDASARALDFNAKYRWGDVVKPTTTVKGKTMYIGFIYNSAGTGTWDAVGSVGGL